MFFMELISAGYEDTKYLINRFVLQECGIILGGCLTVKNQGGLFTGGDGDGFRVTLRMRLHTDALLFQK